jgi:hypothetical protein
VIVDDFPVRFSTTANGGKKYSALLSKLIPAAIQNDSPIKGSCDFNPVSCLIDEISLERNGRLYRPNIRDDPQHLHLGKIDALLDGSASALKANALNEYTLRKSEKGTFECDIFWDQLTGGAIAGQIDGHRVSTGSFPALLLGLIQFARRGLRRIPKCVPSLLFVVFMVLILISGTGQYKRWPEGISCFVRSLSQY